MAYRTGKAREGGKRAGGICGVGVRGSARPEGWRSRGGSHGERGEWD